MKKTFRNYIVVWAILVVIFNVIVFVTPNEIAGLSKLVGAFWTGYIFIMLAFVGQLSCAYFAFRDADAKKLFLNLPLITISYTALLVSVILGTLCIVIPFLPNWIAIIVCVLTLGVNAIAVIEAKAAAEIVSSVEEKVKARTFFIKDLTVDAENLMSRASNEQAKAATKKVYEAVRYSDPMSNAALDGIESQIILIFNELVKEVNNESQEITKIAEEVVLLITERNKKCKLLK